MCTTPWLQGACLRISFSQRGLTEASTALPWCLESLQLSILTAQISEAQLGHSGPSTILNCSCVPGQHLSPTSQYLIEMKQAQLDH